MLKKMETDEDDSSNSSSTNPKPHKFLSKNHKEKIEQNKICSKGSQDKKYYMGSIRSCKRSTKKIDDDLFSDSSSFKTTLHYNSGVTKVSV